jgi:phosphopantothenoylcysteine decarboxylase/phosphopantothenate--cysteine ligase
MPQGKKILLGITGSIAAYKSIILLRLLKKAGAEVKVIITPAAKEFISPLVLSTLSGNRTIVELQEGDQWENHVALGRWADLFVIAPLSCNTMAKMANGQCDNLLLAVYLSACCPVMLAPAMDEDMWKHPATKNNLNRLKERGHLLCSVGTGELASGLIGEGRMSEPEMIYNAIHNYFDKALPFKGIPALVTAGPTYEPIDPVRFIGNHSSGKMGIAIAAEMARRGADVTLVLGPSSETIPSVIKKVIRVTTAEEMMNACMPFSDSAKVIIMAAAVADYRPADIASFKLKKSDQSLHLSLMPTTDILRTLGKNKKQEQLLIGFALETNNEERNALKKLEEKGADMIILNSMKEEGVGFGVDTNKITVFEKGGNKTSFSLKLKTELASDIADLIEKKLHA